MMWRPWVLASALMLMADAPAVARDRVIMPQGRGTPVAMLAPELPAGSLAEGEQAVFEVAFTVDLRGRVTTSRLVSSTHATLGDRVVEQHRQWLYAVADRNDDCKVQRFSAVQSIVIARQKGKLRLGVEAAREIALLPTELGLQASEGPLIDNYEAVFRSMSYPREAIVRGEGASFALIVEFGADGKATEVYPVNAFEDDFGFVDAALRAARRFEANQAVAKGRPFAVCLPVSFKVR